MEERVQTVSGRDPVTGEPITTVHKEFIRTSVDEKREHELRNRANMNLLAGIALGGAIAIGAMMFFANETGSFETAGATLDQKVDAAASDAADATKDAAKAVGKAAKKTGEAVDDTITNTVAPGENK